MKSSLSSVLPEPKHSTYDEDIDVKSVFQLITDYINNTNSSNVIPKYGMRKGWFPQSDEDFGDGGSYPEIPCAQFPLNLGKTTQRTSNAVPVQLDDSGKILYDAILKQDKSSAAKIVHSKFESIVPYGICEDDVKDSAEEEEEIKKVTERTREAIEKELESKLAHSMPVKAAFKPGPSQYIRYTPAQQGESFNSSAQQRIIRMVEMQRDPMEPPRFKINTKVPCAPPSPPAPVLHSPPRKITVKEQQEWKIPPCISNWKNPRGFTVPLDKRLASDGRGLQDPHINDKFAKLAEALYIADRKARESVEIRAQMEKRMVQKEKEQKEDKLRKLAQQARQERTQILNECEYDPDARARDEFRLDRQRERDRERRQNKPGSKKGSVISRDKERDISEQIALSMASGQPTQESLYDQRLFNQTRGLDSGFEAGEDESYNVYSEPWRAGASGVASASHVYRPSRNIDTETYGQDFELITKTDRFVPEASFAGVEAAESASARTGPVQFEKSSTKEIEEDPFQLDKFLSEAKKGKKTKYSSDESRDDFTPKSRKNDAF